MLTETRKDTLKRIFRVQVEVNLDDSDDIIENNANKEDLNHTRELEKQNLSLPSILINPETGQEVSFFDFPRNALCPCGSNRKFKHCHGTPHEFARLLAS